MSGDPLRDALDDRMLEDIVAILHDARFRGALDGPHGAALIGRVEAAREALAAPSPPREWRVVVRRTGFPTYEVCLVVNARDVDAEMRRARRVYSRDSKAVVVVLEERVKAGEWRRVEWKAEP